MGTLRLTTTLQKRGPAAAVLLDDEQVQRIGEGAKRFPVAATVNGYTWRTTVMRKRPKTRERRVAQTLEQLREGKAGN
jgi:hypothetical protein